MDFDKHSFDDYIKGLFNESSDLFSEDAIQLKYPSMYSVILEDVNETPRDFLVFVISELFNKSKVNALASAKKLQKGSSVVLAICTRDVAETKITEVTEYSFDNGYPLKCTMQKGKQNVIEKS
ncbi:MAG: ATP-dependent Clp protease adapter ClpS [Rickettsiaceae bacterium]|jgi:ATP-dependent Clp protease adaptor protein ClpS|nr:ATP-dependent Clp protease adapter ClpS [Rickettsiaceae bacterium]